MERNETAIRTIQLTRKFNGVTAVDDLSIEVEKGSVFGFLGPNGSGKTTTIRLLLGLLAPDSGEASVAGFDVRTESAQIRQNCGALLEHTGLYERLSAYDNLDFYGRVWHLDRNQRRQRIQELFEALNLWERCQEPVVDWSRGMKQKAAIARAMLHAPQVLFLDEPTAGLDPVAAAALREDLLAMAKQQGVTVFVTTHNLTEAEKICDQVAVIKSGRLLSVGSPDQLRMAQGTTSLTIVGSGFTPEIIQALQLRSGVEKVEKNADHITVSFDGSGDSSAMLKWLMMEGVEVEEARKGSASLEEAFLELLEENHVE